MVEVKYIKIFHVPRQHVQRVCQRPGTGHTPFVQHAHFTEVTPADTSLPVESSSLQPSVTSFPARCTLNRTGTQVQKRSPT